MAKKSPAYACKDCGDAFARWAGRCPSCGAMNSIGEVTRGEAELLARSDQQVRAAAALASEPAAGGSAKPLQAPRLTIPR